MNFALIAIIDFVTALVGAGVGHAVAALTERGQTLDLRRRVLAFTFAMISMFVVFPLAMDLCRHFQSH